MDRTDIGLLAVEALEAASARSALAGLLAWAITLAPIMAACTWLGIS